MANHYRTQRKDRLGSPQKELRSDGKGVEGGALLVDHVYLHDFRLQGRHALALAQTSVHSRVVWSLGHRLTRRLRKDVTRQERIVFWVSIATIVSWVASVLAHLLGCVPIQRVWRVAPYAGGKWNCHHVLSKKLTR